MFNNWTPIRRRLLRAPSTLSCPIVRHTRRLLCCILARFTSAAVNIGCCAIPQPSSLVAHHLTANYGSRISLPPPHLHPSSSLCSTVPDVDIPVIASVSNPSQNYRQTDTPRFSPQYPVASVAADASMTSQRHCSPRDGGGEGRMLLRSLHRSASRCFKKTMYELNGLIHSVICNSYDGEPLKSMHMNSKQRHFKVCNVITVPSHQCPSV